MDNLVGAQGNDVLFDQQFDSIRRRLEKAEGTDAVGPETVLNSRENFRSRTEMRAKRVRKTPRTALMLRRLEAIHCTQTGVPPRNERIHCFAITKI
jgi:hypothetical protein